MASAQTFQREFDRYKRPDNALNNIRVSCVDPGLVRAPMLRGYITFGSLWGLFMYLILWPLWWIILKSAWGGAQTILYCAMSPIDYGHRGENGWEMAAYCRDCKDARYVLHFDKIIDSRYQRDELISVEACGELKRRTDQEIAEWEARSAMRRNKDKETQKEIVTK
jgi:hypothetical protein